MLDLACQDYEKYKSSKLIWKFLLIFILFSPVILFASNITHIIPNSDSIALAQILKKVNNGDLVVLSGGEYKGNFEINKSIKLTSNNSATLTSDFKNTVLKINTANVVISNLIFKNSGDIIQNQDACIYVSKGSHHINISDNIFDQCLFAIWLKGSNYSVISNNKIIGTTQKLLSNRGNNIQIWFNKGTVIKNNTITKGRDGIYISNSTDIHIVGNKMEYTRFGVHFMYNQYSILSNNIVTNGSVGLALMDSIYLHVINNYVTRNHTHGFFFRRTDSSKFLNNIAKYNEDGIFLGGSEFNLLTGNELIGNNYGLVITIGVVKRIKFMIIISSIIDYKQNISM